MAIKFYPFNSQNGDRKYSADDVARANEMLFSNGVMVAQGQVMSTELKVEHISGLRVKVNVGACMINGRTVEITNDGSDYILETVPTTTAARIDRVVARLHYSNRKIEIVVKEGTTVAPTLQRDTDIYELSLAQLHLGVNSTNITTVVDERDNLELCGIANVQIGVQPPLRPTGDSALNIKVTDETALKYGHISTPQNPLTVDRAFDLSTFPIHTRLSALLANVNAETVGNALGYGIPNITQTGRLLRLYQERVNDLVPAGCNSGGWSYTSELLGAPQNMFDKSSTTYCNFAYGGTVTITLPANTTINKITVQGYSNNLYAAGWTMYYSMDGVNFIQLFDKDIAIQHWDWYLTQPITPAKIKIVFNKQNTYGDRIYNITFYGLFANDMSKQIEHFDSIREILMDFTYLANVYYNWQGALTNLIRNNPYSAMEYREIFNSDWGKAQFVAYVYQLDRDNIKGMADIVDNAARLKQLIINSKDNRVAQFEGYWERLLMGYQDRIRTTLANSPLFAVEEYTFTGSTAEGNLGDDNCIVFTDSFETTYAATYNTVFTALKTGNASTSERTYTGVNVFKAMGIGTCKAKNGHSTRAILKGKIYRLV